MRHSEEKMRDILFGAFNGNISETDEETKQMLDLFLDNQEKRTTFVDDLRELILDSSQSFASKARRYELRDDEDESKAEALFQTIWRTMTSEPWPCPN